MLSNFSTVIQFPSLDTKPEYNILFEVLLVFVINVNEVHVTFESFVVVSNDDHVSKHCYVLM